MVSGRGMAARGSAAGLDGFDRAGFAGLGTGSVDFGCVDFSGVGNGDADGACACAAWTPHNTSITGKIAKKRPTRASPRRMRHLCGIAAAMAISLLSRCDSVAATTIPEVE
jgi:hypothetical protein